ncbi:hypothetical protein D9M71_765900 [compost metagenome]
MRGDFVGDVAGGAPKPGELAVVADGPRRYPTETVLPIVVAVGAAQIGQLLRVGVCLGIEPRRQRCGIAGQQLVERLPEPRFDLVTRDADEALRQVGQTLLPIGFPDPVGSGLGHCAKSLFAGFQRLVALLQAQQAEVDCP